MPYIPQNQRSALDNGKRPENCGQLNYVISSILNREISEKGLSYTTINTLIGVLECAKLELYRRIATHYEDTKIVENGDVYGP
jgi:hypothetical protein